jgi:Putative MetA-pathway of phenol degradation
LFRLYRKFIGDAVLAGRFVGRRRRIDPLVLNLVLWAVASPIASLAEEEAPLPNELAVSESIVMTDRDELYASPEIEFFRLPDQQRLTLGSEIAYGLTDRLQGFTTVPYVFVNPDHDDNANGIGDVSVGTRYAVVDYREHPFGLDVGFGLETPTGDDRHDLGDGRVSSELSFTASAWLGPVNAQINAGWHHALDNGGDEPEDEAEYNAALIYPLREWFLVLEGNGESNHESTKYYVTPEMIWKPTEHLEFRVAAPCPVTHDAGDYAVVAGFTIEFEHVFEHLFRQTQHG